MKNSNRKRITEGINDLPHQPDLSKFFRYAVFVVFAVVIAESFPQSVNVFLPSEDDQNYIVYERIENACTLVLAYYFVVSGWLNYFKAIIINPHTHTIFGTSRFIVDLFIIYLYYYLLNVISNKTYHGHIFVWIFPTIFGAFLLWDWLRYREYLLVKREPKQAHAHRKNRLLRTGLVLALFIVLSALYVFVIPTKDLTLDGINVWNIAFIVFSFGTVIVYRWKTSNHPKGRSKRH